LSSVTIYVRLVRLQVRSQLQYTANFLMSILATFLFTSLDLATILVIFSNVRTLGGWTAQQVLLLYGAAASSYALADMLLGSLDRLPQLIREGNFDSMLFRPRSPFFQLLASDFMLSRSGRLIQSIIVVIVICTVYIHIAWTAGAILILMAAVISGAVILGSVWVAGACISFWIEGASEFVNTFSSGALFVTQYPINIYAQWLQIAVTFILPIGFVIFMPASYLLHKAPIFDMPSVLRLFSPLVAILAAAAATALWRLSIRHYRSAGG